MEKSKEMLADLRVEIKARKLVIKKLNTAVKFLSQTADKKRAARVEKREKLLQYKTYEEAQEAYGWGFITEEEFDEVVKRLEDTQADVDKPSAEELAVSTLLGWIKLCMSDIADLEFQMLPPEKQDEIRENNYRLLEERQKRLKNRRGTDEDSHLPN